MTSGRVFDEGAALERTQLAWVRTGLAVLATSALAVRLMLDEPTWLAVGVALVGGAGAVVLLLFGQWRYRAVHRALWTRDAAAPGVLPAAQAVRAATVSVVALSALLLASVALEA